jgi:hypothetical protein
MSEYVGSNSCSARKRGWYIKKVPSSLSYYAALIWASYNDYKLRYKYDDTQGCKKVYCGAECLEKKLHFVLLLAKWNAPRHYKKVSQWVEHVLKYRRLPAEVKQLYRKAIIYVK